MTEGSSADRSRVRLALSEDSGSPAEAAPWIGPLVALGGMAARYARKQSERQLIVTLSVPRRDFAAALVACGWVITKPAPQLDPPLETLRNLEPGTPVRLVTKNEVVADYLVGFYNGAEPSVKLRESQWLVSKITAVAKMPGLDGPVRAPRPGVGCLGRWAKVEGTWADRLASPWADLAIVGTLKWLREDFDAFVTTDDPSAEVESSGLLGVSDTIAELLVPKHAGSPTWFTCLYASSRLADQLPIPKHIQGVILDGAGAMKYITEIEAPVVMCILDRSVADDTAAEIVMQLRNSRGEPLSLSDNLGWRPPTGVEAIAFTVAL